MRRIVGLFLLLMLLEPLALQASTPIELTEQERTFIDEHPQIRIGIDPMFVPFEFINNRNEHDGISAEVLNLISERTGLTFTYDPTLSWTQTVQKTRERAIDVLPAVGYTPARAQYMTFVKPFMQFQRAIVVKNSNTTITKFEDLNYRQVAVQRDSSHEGFLLYYPDILMRLYDTVEEALLAVHRGDEVAFIGNEATSIYLSRKLGLTELQYIPVNEGGLQDLHMAVRSDWPLLASILQKGLDSISETEYGAIFDRWIRYESRFDFTPYLRGAAVIFAILLIFLISSIFWISRLKAAVKAKDAAQRQAQQADQEKSRFLARVSHEIRTPLNGIRGMSYLLEKTPLDATQQRYVKTIGNATQTMQTILNDILEFTRIDEDRIILEHIPFTLDDILENCISIESYLIHQKGLAFRLNQDGQVEQHLIGDPTRLSQILINLLNNAIKFTDEGSITLSVHCRKTDPDACILEFEVSDTGIGMDEQQLENLFKPFVQGGASIHRKYGGSGLGLSIVKALVQKMGGTLTVASQIEKGTTFTVTLPLQIDEKGLEAERLREKSIDFSSVHALVICSDRYLAERLHLVLNAYRISSESVSSPSLAAKLLKEAGGFSLLIVEVLDLQVFSPVLADELSHLGANRPKVIAFIHEGLQQGNWEFVDISLPLPLINSVLFNGLLQLFAPDSEKKPYAETPDERNTLPLTILVVEDNPTNQIIAREILERRGWTVYLAENGKTGYERFCELEGNLDLVLMDLHMDVMDGYDSSTLIRQKNQEVPIVVTSADRMDSVRKRCSQIGVTDLVGKPYDPDQLVQTIYRYGSAYHKKLRKIDIQLGITMMGGDKQLYRRVLASFINDLETLVPALKSALDEGRSKEAALLAHKVKGVAGSVGAMNAHALCATLQGLLDEGKQAKPELKSTVLAQLEGVLEEARQYLAG